MFLKKPQIFYQFVVYYKWWSNIFKQINGKNIIFFPPTLQLWSLLIQWRLFKLVEKYFAGFKPLSNKPLMESQILFFTAKEHNYAECGFGYMNVQRKKKNVVQKLQMFSLVPAAFWWLCITDDRINCTFSSKSCSKTIKTWTVLNRFTSEMLLQWWWLVYFAHSQIRLWEFKKK